LLALKPRMLTPSKRVSPLALTPGIPVRASLRVGWPKAVSSLALTLSMLWGTSLAGVAVRVAVALRLPTTVRVSSSARGLVQTASKATPSKARGELEWFIWV